MNVVHGAQMRGVPGPAESSIPGGPLFAEDVLDLAATTLPVAGFGLGLRGSSGGHGRRGAYVERGTRSDADGGIFRLFDSLHGESMNVCRSMWNLRT